MDIISAGNDTRKLGIFISSLFIVAPEIDKQPNIAKAAAQTRDNGIIKCHVISHPKPTTQWSKDGQVLTVDGSKYEEGYNKEGDFKHKFSLTVKAVGESDYGSYGCKIGRASCRERV